MQLQCVLGSVDARMWSGIPTCPSNLLVFRGSALWLVKVHVIARRLPLAGTQSSPRCSALFPRSMPFPATVDFWKIPLASALFGTCGSARCCILQRFFFKAILSKMNLVAGGRSWPDSQSRNLDLPTYLSCEAVTHASLGAIATITEFRGQPPFSMQTEETGAPSDISCVDYHVTTVEYHVVDGEKQRMFFC
jgi:hypothetical protein